jgi:hypothetical protein
MVMITTPVLTKYYYCYQVTETEMRGACGSKADTRSKYKILGMNPQRKNHLGKRDAKLFWTEL